MTSKFCKPLCVPDPSLPSFIDSVLKKIGNRILGGLREAWIYRACVVGIQRNESIERAFLS